MCSVMSQQYKEYTLRNFKLLLVALEFPLLGGFILIPLIKIYTSENTLRIVSKKKSSMNVVLLNTTITSVMYNKEWISTLKMKIFCDLEVEQQMAKE